jgi:hypothetical protein
MGLFRECRNLTDPAEWHHASKDFDPLFTCIRASTGKIEWRHAEPEVLALYSAVLTRSKFSFSLRLTLFIKAHPPDRQTTTTASETNSSVYLNDLLNA